MRILLIGGGTGGHITPLLAVAHELKIIDSTYEIIGVCEKNSKFVGLYQNDKNIDRVFQVRAGKYRRYAGLPLWKKIIDIKTLFLNFRDIFYTLIGYFEAKGLLKQLKPDVILIKGGFVAVPVGKAAAKLGINYLTHDSDSTPGLANRLIAKDATTHATGMPVELYSYPKKKTVFTGIPLSKDYKKVSPALRASYRDKLGLSACNQVVAFIGSSQGATQINEDVISISSRLMDKYKALGMVIIAGKQNETEVKRKLKNVLLADELRRVVVMGFVSDLYMYSGASDRVVSRASATVTAEYALQALPTILIPGQLAGNHQKKNSDYYVSKGAAVSVVNQDKESLFKTLSNLLDDPKKRTNIARELHKLAKPDAAKELAKLTIEVAKK